jgi:hypothetical protein
MGYRREGRCPEVTLPQKGCKEWRGCKGQGLEGEGKRERTTRRV